MSLSRAALTFAALSSGTVSALDNGLATTPPMGFNSYMAPSTLHDEKGLSVVADFFVSKGLHAKGYTYVNTDEGWELKDRDNKTGQLQWDPTKYPSGLPTFIEEKLHKQGLKYGIYGAASGVTCGGDPGNLYHELTDADTYVQCVCVCVCVCGVWGASASGGFAFPVLTHALHAVCASWWCCWNHE